VVATRNATEDVRRGNRKMRMVSVHGAEPDYMEVENFPLASGRSLQDRDELDRASVCVLGSEVADQLFGPLDPLGREIRLAGTPLTVVGVGSRKGSSFGQSQDQYVIVPLSTFEKLYGRGGSVTIQVRSRGQEHFAEAQEETRVILRQRRHLPLSRPDDFDVVTPDMYIGLWKNLSGAIFVVIVGVSMISLVVGGIVIMNIMLVSVTERTREIGIRKAVGARRKDVLAQFLIEATTLSLAGGFVGLALGVGFALVLGWVTPLPTFISPIAVTLGIASSTAVGVFFGAYPAARAARLPPVDALRYE
jgi:putative ABC transport system permease protein